MTKYLIQYNDKYGNGDNKTIEGYLDKESDFTKWLIIHNQERASENGSKIDKNGKYETDENEEEFDIIRIEKLI
jgi:hypothetical protein